MNYYHLNIIMTDLSQRKHSKSRQILVINQLKRKEEQWNNRFNVRPPRDRPEDMDVVATQFQPGKVRRVRPESQKRVGVSMQLEKKLTRQISVMESAWSEKNVPDFYSGLFLKALTPLSQLNLSVALDLVTKEMELLQINNSYIQRCLMAIKSRENCLAKLIDQV